LTFFNQEGTTVHTSKQQKEAVYKVIIQNTSLNLLKHKEFAVPWKTFDDKVCTSF